MRSDIEFKSGATRVRRQPEHSAFTGGYTVETYGGHHADGIDAIQLEIVAELRTNPTVRATLATDLANAIVSLLPRWLPSRPDGRARHDSGLIASGWASIGIAYAR
jgi:hypothetical protein